MFNKLIVATMGVLLMGCGHTVRPGSVGLKYRSLKKPALQSEPLADGFYWQWSWNKLVSYDTTWQKKSVRVDVLTADDLHVPTTLSVTFRPVSTRVYELHTTIGPEYYTEIIEPSFINLIRSEFAKYDHNDLARESQTISDTLLTALAAQVKDKPIEIGVVNVEHIMFDPSVTQSISNKLVMEQQAEQKAFEITIAEKEAEIARARAKGRADAARIFAEGEGQAIVIRGRAQAEAQEAINNTLTSRYIQYKAFDGDKTRYYFAPIGRDGLPIIIKP